MAEDEENDRFKREWTDRVDHFLEMALNLREMAQSTREVIAEKSKAGESLLIGSRNGRKYSPEEALVIVNQLMTETIALIKVALVATPLPAKVIILSELLAHVMCQWTGQEEVDAFIERRAAKDLENVATVSKLKN